MPGRPFPDAQICWMCARQTLRSNGYAKVPGSFSQLPSFTGCPFFKSTLTTDDLDTRPVSQVHWMPVLQTSYTIRMPGRLFPDAQTAGCSFHSALLQQMHGRFHRCPALLDARSPKLNLLSRMPGSLQKLPPSFGRVDAWTPFPRCLRSRCPFSDARSAARSRMPVQFQATRSYAIGCLDTLPDEFPSSLFDVYRMPGPPDVSRMTSQG